MFFDRPDYDLASVAVGSFAIAPSDAMIDAPERDYANTIAMIFGPAPDFDEVLASVKQIEQRINLNRI